MELLRPNGQRSKKAMLLIWLLLAFELIAFASSYVQYDLLQMISRGEEISMDTATLSDASVRIIGIIHVGLFLISGITFIQWFRRAYFNLHLKVHSLSFTEGWAAGSWFVQIICLYRAKQIMTELYEQTKKVLTQKGVPVNEKFTTNLLPGWWALWIVNNLLGQFIFRYSLNANSIDDSITLTQVSMIGNVIGIPLALITLKIISDYAKVEPLLFEIKDEEKPPIVEEVI